MAGILITFGEDIQDDHKKVRHYFTQFKDFKIVHEDTDKKFYLSKFSREGINDLNYSVKEDSYVCVVGTLIYKKKIGKDALEDLHMDLQGNPIDTLIKNCDGPFCLIIKNSAGQQGLWIVTDHAGIINMYTYQLGSTCVISSSSLSLSRNYPVTPEYSAIAQFLRTGNVYGSATIYKEIKVLEPASIYKFKDNFKNPLPLITKYWESPITINEKASLEESRDMLVNSLLNSFEIFSKENLICDFTAGFDSRLNMAILSQFRPFSDIHSFVFGPDVSKEVTLVKEYCKTLRIQYHHLRLPDDWHENVFEYVKKALSITDGEENIFTYAPILYAQEYKAHDYRYSINGLGGELYRDFWWIQEIFSLKRPANLDRLISTRILQYEYDYSILSDNWTSKMKETKDILKNLFSETISDMDLNGSYNTLQIDNLYFRQKIRRWAGRTMSSTNQVINTLSPLTLKKCVEVALSIPPQYKRNGRLVKNIIENLSWPLSGMRMLNGSPCQNVRIWNLHKFVPLLFDYGERGVRKIVQNVMNRTILMDTSINYPQSLYYLLLSDSFKVEYEYDSLYTQEFYNRERYAKFYQDARNGNFHYYNQLGNIITLEMRMKQDMIRV